MVDPIVLDKGFLVGADASSIQSNEFAAPANAVIYIVSYSKGKTSSVPTNAPTSTHPGIGDPVKVDEHARTFASSDRRLAIYRAKAGSQTHPGKTTINLQGAADSINYWIGYWPENLDFAPVIQVKHDDGPSISITLDAPPIAGSIVLGFCGANFVDGTDPGSNSAGYTEFDNVADTSPREWLSILKSNSDPASDTCAWTGFNSNGAAIVMELAPGGSTPTPGDPPRQSGLDFLPAIHGSKPTAPRFQVIAKSLQEGCA